MARRPRVPLEERHGFIGILRRQWAWFLTVAIFGFGTLYAIIPPPHWRRGTSIMAFSLVLAGVLRLVLRSESGLLHVRSRWFDAGCLLLTGIAMAVMSLWLPPG